MLFAALLASTAVACNSGGTTTKTTGSTKASAATSASAAGSAAGSNAAADGDPADTLEDKDMPTEEEFAEKAEKDIKDDNYKDELAKIEVDMGPDPDAEKEAPEEKK